MNDVEAALEATRWLDQLVYSSETTFSLFVVMRTRVDRTRWLDQLARLRERAQPLIDAEAGTGDTPVTDALRDLEHLGRKGRRWLSRSSLSIDWDDYIDRSRALTRRLTELEHQHPTALAQPVERTRAGGATERLRNPSLMVFAPLAIGFFILASFISDAPGIWYTGVVFLLLFAIRPSLRIEPHGLVVTNLLPRRYRWDEIDDVAMSASIYPILTIQIRGTRKRKRVWAVGVGKGRIGAGWARQTARRVRARWEQETGIPPQHPYRDW